MITPFAGKPGDEVSGSGHMIGGFLFHMRNISFFDIL
jgi:hypothetical protein